MAAVEGTPERLKTLLSSFLQSSTSEGGSTKQSTQDPSSKASLSLCQPRSKEAFWSRVETYSAFTWFAKPQELSPLYCSLYGWENVDVDILKCVRCKACIDATMPDSWDPKIFAKCCKQLKESLITAHTKLCPWPDNPCPDVFVQLPVYTQDQWKKDFLMRSHSLMSLGTNLPLFDDIAYSEMNEVSDEHIDGLQQLFQTSNQELFLRTNVESMRVNKTSILIALCGWDSRHSDVDADHCTLFCTMCRRELGLWNFKSISSLSEERNLTDKRSTLSVSSQHASQQPSVQQSSQSSSQIFESMDTSQQASAGITPADQDTEPMRSFAGCKRTSKGFRNVSSFGDSSKQSVDNEEYMEIELRSKLKGHEDDDRALSTEPPSRGVNTDSVSPMVLSESNVKEISGSSRETLLLKRLLTGRDSPLKGKLGAEEMPYRSPLHSSISDLSEKEHCESLCVEVEEESLSDKLQAVESELEFMAGQNTTDKEDYAPDIKRIRLEDLEKKAFNPLSEHRSWCPWVTCVITERAQSSLECDSGWRMLLHTLLPSLYPEKVQNFTNVPPREAWKPVKLLLNECGSSLKEKL